MRKKVYDFVYLNTGNYISYGFLQNFYWYIFIIPFSMAVMSIALIHINGVSWKTLFPLVSITVWSILYWAFVLTIKSRHDKGYFNLRFLVNGIVGVAISSLIWIFLASFNLVADKPFFNFNVFLWMIPIYMLVSVLYIASIIIGVHNGVCVKIKVKGKTIVAFSTSISIAAGLGIAISRLLREMASQKVQHIVITFCTVILIFVPILAHINFVQYFYCKKYNINCDQNGDTTSSGLELYKETKKKKRVFLKILLVLLCIFVAFCIMSFIKGFLRGIS